MPIVPSHFRPPPFLANGHLQTLLPVLLPRRFAPIFQRERHELPDGDFLDLDWARAGHKKLAILTHGLEGCSRNGYIRGMAAALASSGWDVLAWNFRGCSGETNRLLRFYHSGETGDLAALVTLAACSHEQIALVGFSLGGNVTLKYLGEGPVHPAVMAGVGISVPVDLAASSRVLDRHPLNRIYLRRFIRSLTDKVRAKAPRFAGQLDTTGLGAIRTFAEFDGRYTAPLHGFRNADDYWERSSARRFLAGISRPTLLLNARNDPFLPAECFPVDEAERNPELHLETPASGGHVGFLDFARGLQPWSERRVPEFLSANTHPSE